MQRLIDAGHAYASGGDVYFDVTSFPDYGSLSGQRLDHMRAADDTEDAGHKRDPRDFALWKGAKPGEPSWPTPWGPGRPGWHLECSAMSTKYLGSDVRHPRRRPRPALPAPRERAGPVARGRRRVRPVLVAQRPGPDRRREDEQVARQLAARRRDDHPGPAGRAAVLPGPGALTARRSTTRRSALAEAATAYRRIEGFVTRAAELLGRRWAGSLHRRHRSILAPGPVHRGDGRRPGRPAGARRPA